MASIGSCCLAPEDSIESIEARGLKCPLPVLKLEKRLASLDAGERLVVLATDPMAKIDIPLYCRKLGYSCAIDNRDEGVLAFTIAKPAAAAAPAGGSA